MKGEIVQGIEMRGCNVHDGLELGVADSAHMDGMDAGSESAVTGFLALCGHMRMHWPQSMHRDELMTACPPRILMASVGQCLRQVVQPVHLSWSRATECL